MRATKESRLYDHLKARYCVLYPATIRQKLAAWAIQEPDTADYLATELERCDFAGFTSPAPRNLKGMAREVGEHWPEVEAAYNAHREATGQAWTPEPGHSVFTVIWLAYAHAARQLAADIRREAEHID